MSDHLVPVQFHVNGRPIKTEVPTDLPLVDFLQSLQLCHAVGSPVPSKEADHQRSFAE